MEITRIIGVGIIGVILSVTVKNYRPELGICTALATGIVILVMVIPHLESAIGDIYSLCGQSEINIVYIKTVIKIIGIAYITQFASELAKDAGEGAAAKKIEFAGKVFMLAMMMPIVKNLLAVIVETLTEF